ncbi:MAG TPA: pyridoxal-dependent decarboxylase [Pseudonocardiaceae bacterium]|jgi:glutamate/tyrosine decarboxylase-like PLP-dependent enzyme|nr:pyridoxal-dependent decarboxylase [Pseudonocardiaceae bacterium]
MTATPAQLVAAAAQAARRYLDGIADRPVAPAEQAVATLAELTSDLPDAPLGAEEVLRQLDEIGSAATVASAGPRYFGFVVGGALPAALGAAVLGAAWDQNNGYYAQTPIGATLDEIALRWVVELLGLPPGAGGGFVSGASTANSTCLAVARDQVLIRAGWNALADGLLGAPPVRVVVGEEAHPSVFKALGLIGLGRDRAIRLPVDEQGRIIPRDLPKLGGPTIVCLQAGNVNSGASDPFEPLIDWAHDSGAWVHVDGAFGIWAAAAPDRAEQVRGVQRADSWATDAHKWLNTTYDSGIALVRDPEQLRASMAMSAAYLVPTGRREPAHYTPAMSQRARGVEVWAVLASLGRSGLAELVENCCRLATRFADGLRAEGFTVLNDVVLNQVVVTVEDGSIERIIDRVQREGTCWAGPTHWRGRQAMRLSLSNWSTTEADVDKSIAAIAAARHDVSDHR